MQEDTGDTQVDKRYYEVVRPTSFSEKLLIAARDHMYADLVHSMQPNASDQLLDVGVSDVINDGANMLERKYPHPGQITAAGLGTAEVFQAAFPAVTYRQITPNQPLPFADASFDVVVSNAVVEHVGSTANQRFFVQELARVGRRVFITTPHRYFPVEHHTSIPLLHWWKPGFHAACRVLNKTSWTDEANLILMNKRALSALAPAGRRARVGLTGLPLGPFSSNLYLALDPAA